MATPEVNNVAAEVQNSTSSNITNSIQQSIKEAREKRLECEAKYNMQKEIYYAMNSNYQDLLTAYNCASQADKGMARQKLNVADSARFDADTMWTISRYKYDDANSYLRGIMNFEA